MEREVKRLACPDVQCWLVFEGTAQPLTIPGSATTDVLQDEATRLHNLEAGQRLSFLVNGASLPLGKDISETPLANTENQKVTVRPLDWPVRRQARTCSTIERTGIAATRIPRKREAVGKRLMHIQTHPFVNSQVLHDASDIARFD